MIVSEHEKSREERDDGIGMGCVLLEELTLHCCSCTQAMLEIVK